jgi:hypothetical protein
MNQQIKYLKDITEMRRQCFIDIVEKDSEKWKRLPYLCLLADGRGGYWDGNSRCYYHKTWALKSSLRNGVYTVFVDCKIGKLFTHKSLATKFDSYLDQLDIEDFNIDKEIKNVLEYIAKDHTCYGNSFSDKDRNKIMLEYNVINYEKKQPKIGKLIKYKEKK